MDNKDHNSSEKNQNIFVPDFDLSDRLAMLPMHPVREKFYTVPTKSLEAIYSIVYERVSARRTGLCFHAIPRSGKTTALAYVKDRLQNDFPTIVIARVDSRASSRPSFSHMFMLLLESWDHALSKRSNPDILFMNCIADALVRISAKRGSHLVLLIDEMQLLSPTDLMQLLVFHNALEAKKIKLTTISFAQPEILHRRTALLASKERQIIARFLSEPIEFHGCSSAEELKHILSIFDEKSEFPEGSSWSYTKFFVPKAFQNGFRLKKYFKQIWEAMLASAIELDDGSIPMEHVMLVVEHCLVSAFRFDDASFELSNEDIDAAMSSANLAEFSSMMQ